MLSMGTAKPAPISRWATAPEFYLHRHPLLALLLHLLCLPQPRQRSTRSRGDWWEERACGTSPGDASNRRGLRRTPSETGLPKARSPMRPQRLRSGGLRIRSLIHLLGRKKTTVPGVRRDDEPPEEPHSSASHSDSTMVSFATQPSRLPKESRRDEHPSRILRVGGPLSTVKHI